MAAEQVVVVHPIADDSAATETRPSRAAASPPGDEQLAGTLRDRLARVTMPPTPHDLDEVREVVSRYTSDLQSRGWPPERVIMAVKRAAREAGLRASANQALAESRWTDTDKLLAELVRWCIARYYDSPEDVAVARASIRARAETPQHA